MDLRDMLVPSPEKSLQKQEVLLVLMLIDDSSSIRAAGNKQAVIDGYEEFAAALKSAPGEVLVKTMFLNNSESDTGFVDPLMMPSLVDIYDPMHDTPLYIRSLQALQEMLMQARVLADQGYVVRTITFIFTDGGDNKSRGVLPANVKVLADAMFATGTNIIAGCAVNDGRTSFWEVFASMGIPERFIRVLKNDPQHVHATLHAAGTMASEASFSGASFTTTFRTGFVKTPTEN